MRRALYVGVDPGASETSPGGLAWITRKGEVRTQPLVTSNPESVVEAFATLLHEAAGEPVLVGVEVVQPFAPGGRIGASSAATIGRMVAGPTFVCAAYGLAYEMVRSQDWRKIPFGGRKVPKDRRESKKALWSLAKTRWPDAGIGAFTSWSGAADALWIAEYVRRKLA